MDLALNLAYAKSFDSSLRLGGGVKYIQSRIAEVSAQTFAVDLGGQYEFEKMGPGHPQLGLAVQNLGPGLKFLDERSSLPLTVAVGAGYRLPVGLLGAIDYKRRPYSKSEVNVGAEYAVLPSFAIRAGYSSGGAGALDGFAAGFGIKARGYALDYSMAPFGELGLVQRFSLGAKF